MGLFALFKTPINETLATICGAYHGTYRLTMDSSKGFISMAEEAVRQMRKHNCPQFNTAQDTYQMLSGKLINELSHSHDENRKYLEYYLFNMMMYIRPDYYKPENFQKNERLKLLIKDNLN